MTKHKCEHPKHAERKDAHTGRVWCGNCGAPKRYDKPQTAKAT